MKNISQVEKPREILINGIPISVDDVSKVMASIALLNTYTSQAKIADETERR